jgi:hypothetical protein
MHTLTCEDGLCHVGEAQLCADSSSLHLASTTPPDASTAPPSSAWVVFDTPAAVFHGLPPPHLVTGVDVRVQGREDHPRVAPST